MSMLLQKLKGDKKELYIHLGEKALTFEEDFKNLQESKAQTSFVITQINGKTFILACYEASSKISRVVSAVVLSAVSDQLVQLSEHRPRCWRLLYYTSL